MFCTRREWLAATATLGLAHRRLWAEADTRDEPEGEASPEAFPGMIVRMEQPRNLETPLAALRRRRVPQEHFFVRNHFPVPKIDPQQYRLSVTGHVERPLELSLADLQNMGATVRREITLECAGNGRVFLVPAVRGLQWGFGAVGNAEWTGVPLAAVLERVRPKAGAVEVILVGADAGAVADPPSAGVIPFDRGIPIDKARREECLLAWGMNGEPLTPAHGFPLRAVIGGWYGMASVKWLQRIVVSDRSHTGYWQTFDYAFWERSGDAPPRLMPLTAIQPKAIVIVPTPGAVVAAGRPLAVVGRAWAGEAAVAKVEVSTDGGRTWSAAHLEEPVQPFAWTAWKWTWNVPPTPGPATLLARCTDARGRTQPTQRDPDRRTYMINHLVPLELIIRG